MGETTDLEHKLSGKRMLFRKIYDGSENFLGGNCLTGQLLEEGFHQEEEIGKIIRRAYLDSSSINLFPSTFYEDISSSQVFLRYTKVVAGSLFYECNAIQSVVVNVML